MNEKREILEHKIKQAGERIKYLSIMSSADIEAFNTDLTRLAKEVLEYAKVERRASNSIKRNKHGEIYDARISRTANPIRYPKRWQ